MKTKKNINSQSRFRRKRDQKKAVPGRAPKRRRKISIHPSGDEIHDSLEDAITRIEAGKMNSRSAKEILKRIEIMQALLLEAKRELEKWLRSKARRST